MRSITLTNTLKFALGTFFFSLWVFSSSIASADYIAPAYVDQISQPLYLSGYSVGSTFQNRQTAGTEFCTSGGFLYVLENVHVIDSTDQYDGWTTGDILLDVSDTNGGATTLNLLTLANTHGAGYYGFFANNSMGCPLAEDPIQQGSSYAFAYVNTLGYATYYSDASFSFNATSTNQPVTNQYINILSPAYGSTTQSNVNIQVQFKTPLSFDPRPTTTRTVVIRDAVTMAEEERFEETLEAGAGENVILTYNATLSDGSKMVYAYYALENGTIYSETAQSFFNVNINSYELATGLTTPITTPTETQNDCSTFDVGCQFQKAIMFLFYPSQAVLDRFSTLWQNISTKKPFGYVTMTIDALTDLDTNSAHAFDLGEVPFQTAIFDPFKIALGSILWAVYAIYFYQRRLKTLDI